MERKISDIIDTIQKCNREELDLLVERFHPLIKKYSRELPYEEAETDLVIFFINLIDKINLEKFKTKGEGALVNFIRNSLRNKKIDLFRSWELKHEQKNTIVLLDDEGAVMDSSSLDEHSKIEFYDILEAISSKQREVIILKYIKQMTDIEIAEYLGVTRQSVNRLRNRAVEKIKSSYIEG